MARPSTVRRVHAAVIDLATTRGPAALTMEGIAAHAGTGKQTLYRTWPSVSAILFDALLARTEPSQEDSGAPGVRNPRSAIEGLLAGATREIAEEPHASLLRALGAAILGDPDMAREFRERLLRPQLREVRSLVRQAGAPDAERATELLLAPVFYRWFMGLPPMAPADISWLVSHALGATHEPGSPQ